MANKVSVPTTKFGRLLKQLKKTPMTKKEIVTFLLKQSNEPYLTMLESDNFGNADRYNSALYGTKTRAGFLEQYGRKLKNGKWAVNALGAVRPSGPFMPVR